MSYLPRGLLPAKALPVDVIRSGPYRLVARCSRSCSPFKTGAKVALVGSALVAIELSIQTLIPGLYCSYSCNDTDPVCNRRGMDRFHNRCEWLPLARFRLGRILFHLLAQVTDRYIRFHVEGIVWELPWASAARNLLSTQVGKIMESGK